MSEYVFDSDDMSGTPYPGQRSQKTTRAMVPSLPPPAPARWQQAGEMVKRRPLGQLGASEDTVKLIKDLLVLAGVFALFYWLILSPKSPLKNPGRGRGKLGIAKIGKHLDGSYYWRLLRRRAKKHGRFASAGDAVSDAECKGYRVLT